MLAQLLFRRQDATDPAADPAAGADGAPAPPPFVIPPLDAPLFDEPPEFGTPMNHIQHAALPHPYYGTKMITVIWTLVAISAVFLAVRLYCKFSRHRGAWWDDWLLLASWICITAESATLTFATTVGYARPWYDWPMDPAAGKALLIAVNAAGSLSLTAATWSKTSFALTLLRLTDGWVKWFIWFIIVSMNIAMGLSALFVWVQCTPIQSNWDPMVPRTSCWNLKTLPNYNIFSASYSAAMDITLALLPWSVIWGLQMKMKEKIGVAIAMSCGIFAGITAIIKTTKIPAMESTDPGPAVELFIWGNAESCVTIIAACIPILRVFVRDVKTSAGRYYLSNGRNDNLGSSANGTGNHSKSRGGDRHNTITITGGRDPHYLKPEDERELTRDSNGKIMQTKEVAIEYQDNKDAYSSEMELDDLRREKYH